MTFCHTSGIGELSIRCPVQFNLQKMYPTLSSFTTHVENFTFPSKLSRGEICVANLKAPLRMVIVWVVNKSEKTVATE